MAEAVSNYGDPSKLPTLRAQRNEYMGRAALEFAAGTLLVLAGLIPSVGFVVKVLDFAIAGGLDTDALRNFDNACATNREIKAAKANLRRLSVTPPNFPQF